jgi:hypothetical protein
MTTGILSNSVLKRIEFLFASLLLILGCHVPLASAAPPDHPMIFRNEHNGGNCNGCEWISARGTIVRGTADSFEKFMLQRAKEYRLPNGEFGCYSVALDSSGGSLLEGIRLGELLRKYKCSTTVSRSQSAGINEAPNLRELVPGECYSACAYAFLGGTRRSLSSKDRYGVHQHYRSDALLAPLEKTLTAIDLSTSQLLTGLLVSYVIEMGVDPSLVTLASLTSPGENIRLFNKNQLEELNIVTTGPIAKSEWRLHPYKKGLIAEVAQTQDDTKSVFKHQIFCSSQKPSERYMDISLNVESFEGQIKGEISNNKKSMTLLNDKSQKIEVPINNFYFRGPSNDRLMTIRIPLSDISLSFLVNSNEVAWEIESSRASSSFFQGWFPLKSAPQLFPFVFSNCI